MDVDLLGDMMIKNEDWDKVRVALVEDKIQETRHRWFGM